MVKGVIYKNNGKVWSKSTVQDTGNTTSTTWDAGLIKHWSGSTWDMNYPMEQSYVKTFNATWSQGWKGDGTRLDAGVWKGNILVASTTNFRGLMGFNKTDISSFVSTGVITKLRLQINCYETTLNGSPDIKIGKHSYTAVPASTWTGANAEWTDYSTLHVNNGATGAYWVTLKNTQLYMANGSMIGGIAFMGMSATDEDHGKLSGVSSYTSKLEVTVLK